MKVTKKFMYFITLLLIHGCCEGKKWRLKGYGFFSDIFLDKSNTVHTVYYDFENFKIEYARGNLSEGTWQFEEVGKIEKFRGYGTIGARLIGLKVHNDHVYVAYDDVEAQEIKIAMRSNDTWHEIVKIPYNYSLLRIMYFDYSNGMLLVLTHGWSDGIEKSAYWLYTVTVDSKKVNIYLIDCSEELHDIYVHPLTEYIYLPCPHEIYEPFENEFELIKFTVSNGKIEKVFSYDHELSSPPPEIKAIATPHSFFTLKSNNELSFIIQYELEKFYEDKPSEYEYELFHLKHEENKWIIREISKPITLTTSKLGRVKYKDSNINFIFWKGKDLFGYSRVASEIILARFTNETIEVTSQYKIGEIISQYYRKNADIQIRGMNFDSNFSSTVISFTITESRWLKERKKKIEEINGTYIVLAWIDGEWKEILRRR